MQELAFEQVEVVSGGFQGLTAPWEINQQTANKDSAVVKTICTVVDGAIGGLIGNGIGTIIKLAGAGAAAGVGASTAFITPCANNVVACVEDSSKCPTAPKDYIGGPHQPDPLL